MDSSFPTLVSASVVLAYNESVTKWLPDSAWNAAGTIDNLNPDRQRPDSYLKQSLYKYVQPQPAEVRGVEDVDRQRSDEYGEA
jgi:hypothetical protein